MKALSLSIMLFVVTVLSACGGGGGGGGSSVPVPVVSIISPANNSTVNGNITITANASDGTGISKVEFYVDNILVATDTSAPYSFPWDSTAARGAHIVNAKAFNAANASTISPALSLVSSDTISVKVKSVAASSISIYSIEMIVRIPNGVVFNSASATGVASGMTIFSFPSGQDVSVAIAAFNLIPFDFGEFMTLNNTLSLGTVVTPADFSTLLFEPKDGGGNVIGGVTAEIY